jgi:hypothetical protein
MARLIAQAVLQRHASVLRLAPRPERDAPTTAGLASTVEIRYGISRFRASPRAGMWLDRDETHASDDFQMRRLTVG